MLFRSNHHISQSCALALGALCSDWDDANSRDHEACALLTAVYERHRDQQTRAFAVLSLAKIGGAKAQAYLLEQLPRGNKALERPWVACALGVLAARKRANDPEALEGWLELIPFNTGPGVDRLNEGCGAEHVQKKRAAPEMGMVNCRPLDGLLSRVVLGSDPIGRQAHQEEIRALCLARFASLACLACLF